MPKYKNRNSLNDTASIELDGCEALLASMISVSLSDLFAEPPKLKKRKVKFKYLHEEYYPKRYIIDKHKKEANDFFNNPNSLFNKYTDLDKDYLIKHYAEKRKPKENRN